MKQISWPLLITLIPVADVRFLWEGTQDTFPPPCLNKTYRMRTAVVSWYADHKTEPTALTKTWFYRTKIWFCAGGHGRMKDGNTEKCLLSVLTGVRSRVNFCESVWAFRRDKRTLGARGLSCAVSGLGQCLYSRPTSAGLRPKSCEAGREKPLVLRVGQTKLSVISGCPS